MTTEKEPSSAESEDQLPKGEGEVEAGAGKVEGETPPEPPQPKTHSEQEWRDRQSSWDKNLAEKDKAHKDEITKIRKEHEERIEAMRDEESKQFIARVESEGGDVDAAQKVVAKEKAARELERQAKESQAAADAKSAEADAKLLQASEILKKQDATRLAAKYEVDEEPLLKANSPEEMETIALKLAYEKSKKGEKPPVKTDSNVPSGKGADWSKMKPQEKIALGLEGMEF